MTTPVLADPRRSSAPAALGFSAPSPTEESASEMPVLFQLSDLSQQKVLSPPGKSKSQQQLPATAPESEPSVASAPATDAAAKEVRPELESKSESQEPLLAAVAASAAEPSVPTVPDSPTIRQRAQLRERRRQSAAQGDWFQTQGKYILVVFLVLLVGTIYMARRGGDDSPPSPTIDAADLTADSPGELSPLQSPPDEQPQLAAETKDIAPAVDPPMAEATGTPESLMVESSPAESIAPDLNASTTLEQSPAAESSPQVTLQPPVQDDPQPQPGADESLFPWANQPEPRVATRPQSTSPGSSVPFPQANPHFQARPYAPGAAVAVPQRPAVAPPAYPSTGIEGAVAPEATMPADAAAPATYPVVDPAMNRSGSLPPRSASPGAVMPAAYESRVSTAPRTSGPRHERTGSGLY